MEAGPWGVWDIQKDDAEDDEEVEVEDVGYTQCESEDDAKDSEPVETVSPTLLLDLLKRSR